MILRRFAARGLALFATLVLSGCGWLIGPDCTTSLEPGLLVFVVDSVTANPVLSDYQVVATDRAYADTVVAPADPSGTQGGAVLAFERPGTYHVKATAEGYRTWVTEGVRVTEGECHVRTVELEALMQPMDGP
jgi:hypothetical protein